MRKLAVAATAVHVALAFLPLALVLYVARRIAADSCNHLAISPLLVAVACLATLLAAGVARVLWVRRVDALALLALGPALLALAVTYPLDRCNLLIGYGTFTQRHLPDPDPKCCARVARLPACQAAEAAREQAARQRSLQLALGLLPPDLAAVRAAEALEAGVRAQERRAAGGAGRGGGGARAGGATRRREAAAQRWREATSRRLRELRDHGAAFVELGPLAEEQRQRRSGEPRPNGCGAELPAVQVLATPAGWFVPVAAQDFAICSYVLWFVPREATARPVAAAPTFEEFDIDFTVKMLASDFDGDGTVEAVLVRGWAHPEGVGEAQTVVIVEPTGEVRETAFTDVEDIDGDGRLDGVIDYSTTRNAAGCDPNEAWDPEYLAAPTIAFHAVGRQRFTHTDEAARAFRSAACRDVRPLGGAVRRGELNEDEVARRLLCRLADGEPAAVLRAELEPLCQRLPAIPDDCVALRPGACRFRDLLFRWLEPPGPFALP